MSLLPFPSTERKFVVRKFEVLDMKKEFRLLVEPKPLPKKQKAQKPWISDEILKVLFSTKG